MNTKSAIYLVKETGREFSEDNVLRLSAALAYYAIFSIGPLLAIVVGVAGLAFGSDTVRHEIQHQLQDMLGQNSAKIVDSMMSARQHGTSLITTIVGVIALLIGATGVFGQMQDSLNTIWEVKPKPGAGIWGMIRTRFLSFSMVLGIGFLLLVSLALSTAVAAFTGVIGQKIPMGELLAHAFDLIVSFGVVTLLFAMIFKFLPDVKIPWRKVWIGSMGTALLFTLGKFLLGLYLGRQSTASAYGAAGSVIVILMWIYYASVILFFGAEFTHVYAKLSGAKITPDPYARPVTEQERAQVGIPHPAKAIPARAKSAGIEQTPINPPQISHPPVKVIQDNLLEFVSLMFVTGLMAGALLSFKPLRKAVKLYGKIA